jgi:hypothetical protein
LRGLPDGIVAPADPVGKMLFDKQPFLAGLAARYFAPVGLAAQDFRVHVQEGGGIMEEESFHGFGPTMILGGKSIATSGQRHKWRQ